MNKIKLITDLHARDLYRSRLDYAKVTSSDLIERPYWYENLETGQLYYDLYACLAWPSEVTDYSNGLPGYAAVVGVVKPKKTSCDPRNANFQLLAEVESNDVPTLLGKCLEMREQYGFGIQQDLLTTWMGDPERFQLTLALLNENLIEDNGEVHAILITPPDEMYSVKVFDMYVRALRTTLLKDSGRFYFGNCDILKNRLCSFSKDDPCVFAMGGLVFSLINKCRWMNSRAENAFVIEEEV